MLLVSIGCREGTEDVPLEEVGADKHLLAARPLASDTFDITLDVPDSLSLDQILLEARGQLEVSADAEIGTELSREWMIANLTAVDTRIGPGAKVPSVVAVGDVQLKPRTRVMGSILTGGTVAQHPSSSVGGTVSTNAEVRAKTAVSWRVTIPGAGEGETLIQDGNQQSLVPNAYRSLTLEGNSVVRVTSGTYYFGSLTVGPDARVEVDANSGPVFLYVAGVTRIDGVIACAQQQARGLPLLLVHFGETPVHITNSWEGTILAPRARVSLGSESFAGAVFAKDIFVHSSARIAPGRFPWEVVGSNAPYESLGAEPAPILLRAKISPDGVREDASIRVSEPVTFTLPHRIEVECGNAGNGRSILSFQLASGGQVECIYRGGASSMAPTSALDRAEGRFYLWESCTHGAQPGSEYMATQFDLAILDLQPSGRICIEVGLGEGCTSSMGYPMDPADSIRLRDAFSWEHTDPLPALNPQGFPNLYYAYIYVQSPQQLELLNLLRVHYRSKQLFQWERAHLKGKCGALNLSGDGEGLFVFAVLPAGAFNFLRKLALEPGPSDPDIIRAVVIQPSPPGLKTKDGALSYTALKAAGFRYEVRAPNLVGYKQRPFLDDWAIAALELGEDLYEGAKEALAAGDELLSGSVDLRVQVKIKNRDPLFGTEKAMQRLWGPGAGDELLLDGVDIEVELARMIGSVGVNLELARGTTERGVASMSVPDGVEVVQICMELENDAAVLSDFLLPLEVCTPAYFEVTSSHRFLWEVTDWQAHVLNQLTDGYWYMRNVVEFTPPKAKVAVGGFTANALPSPITACLDFPNATDALELLAVVGGVTGVIDAALEAVMMQDMFFPSDADESRLSRGVPSHEYAHYALCSMVYEESPVTGLSVLMADRIAEGQEVDPEDETGILSETFADTLAMQLTGGTSYFESESSPRTYSHSMFYCAKDASNYDPNRLYCLDQNFVEAENTGIATKESNRLIGARASLFHDALDDPDLGYGSSVPNHGHILVQDPASTSKVKVQEWRTSRSDENVSLSGPGIRQWIARWQDRSTSLTHGAFMGGLAAVLREEGNTWCETCSVFALHSPLQLAPGTPSSSPWTDVWQPCLGVPISDYLGEAPPVDDLTRLKYDCTPCPEGYASAGNYCYPLLVYPDPDCPTSGMFKNSVGECVYCMGILWKGVCYNCAAAELLAVADDGTTTCVTQCPNLYGQLIDHRVCIEVPW